MRENKSMRQILLPCLVMTALVLLTRLLTLTHNIYLHPDEHVFYLGSESLAGFLTGRFSAFEEIKEYPEGAIVLLTPFQLLGSGISALTGRPLSPQLCGRLGSTVYFLAGGWIGVRMLQKHFSDKREAMWIYCLILTFSLIHIEQSRYGTGEPVSFFLLTAILLLCADALAPDARRPMGKVYLASFLSGFLAAVKYPQIVFFAAVLFTLVRLTGKKLFRDRRFWLAMLTMLLGFLAVSPKLMADPFHFTYSLLAKESHAYVRYGNVCEIGGPINHLLSLSVYFLLYAGLPAAPLFLPTVWTGRKQGGAEAGSRELIFRFLPLLTAFFFTYNLFAKTLFMRTYYPFFIIADLYAAAAAGDWLAAGGKKRAACLAAAALLVLRGGGLVLAMTETDGAERLSSLMESSVTDSWKKTTLLLPGYFLDADLTRTRSPAELDLTNEAFPGELEHGELVIVSTLDHSRANHYIVPPFHKGVKEIIRRWDDFKEINAPYRVGGVYPEYYYYLFGFWVKGTTGTDYEFPTNAVYYRP